MNIPLADAAAAQGLLRCTPCIPAASCWLVVTMRALVVVVVVVAGACCTRSHVPAAACACDAQWWRSVGCGHAEAGKRLYRSRTRTTLLMVPVRCACLAALGKQCLERYGTQTVCRCCGIAVVLLIPSTRVVLLWYC